MTAGVSTKRKRLDSKKYGRLLAQTLPRVVRSEAENERMLEAVWNLMQKGERNLSPEELELLEVMSALIEKFETERFTVPDAAPGEVLRLLMEEHGLKQKDLLDMFGSSGTVSEVVRGRRSISKSQAKKLAEFFRVPADAFI